MTPSQEQSPKEISCELVTAWQRDGRGEFGLGERIASAIRKERELAQHGWHSFEEEKTMRLAAEARVKELESALAERKEGYRKGTCFCKKFEGDEEHGHIESCPEQARELMEGYCKRIRELTQAKDCETSCHKLAADAIEKARTARVDALEEAAKVCEKHSCWPAGRGRPMVATVAPGFARIIRALKTQEAKP